MSHKNKLDPDHKRFEFRPGVGGFPEWGGLDLRGDASAIAANRLRVAKNIIYWQKEVIARGGQAAVTDENIGPILGIFDTSEDDNSQKIWSFPSGAYANLSSSVVSSGRGDYRGKRIVADASGTNYYTIWADQLGKGFPIKVRVEQLTKVHAGEENLIYTANGEHRVVGLTSGTDAYLPLSGGTVFGGGTLSISPANIDDYLNNFQILYATGGTVYVAITIAGATATETQFYSFTSSAATLIQTAANFFATTITNPEFAVVKYGGGADFLVIGKTASANTYLTAYIGPAFATTQDLGTIAITGAAREWRNMRGYGVVSGTNIFLAGQTLDGGNSYPAVLLIDTTTLSTQSLKEIGSAASGLYATGALLIGTDVYIPYWNGTAARVAKYTGVWTDNFGAFGGAVVDSTGQTGALAVKAADNRFYCAGQETLSRAVARSSVNDLVTDFTSYASAITAMGESQNGMTNVVALVT